MWRADAPMFNRAGIAPRADAPMFNRAGIAPRAILRPKQQSRGPDDAFPRRDGEKK